MRYNEFRSLLEYNRSKTIAALGKAISARAQKDNTDVDTVLSSAEEADPTNNKQYTIWIVNQYVKNELALDQFGSLTKPLRVFASTRAQHKRLNINSDINRYDWRTINDVVEKITSTEVDDKKANALDIPDTKVLYNGPLGVLAIPESEEASCELGSRTKWCTAATKSQNRFNDYNSIGPLYVWIDQKTKKKFQFHFESFQFMNELDDPIERNQLLNFARQHPVTKKLFASKQDFLNKSAEDYIEYMISKAEYDEDPSGYEEEYGDFEENPTWEELDANGLFTLADPNVINKYVKYIKKDDSLSYYYAKSVVNGPWPEGENAILTDNYTIVDYAKNVLKARWPEGEERLIRLIHNDSSIPCKYAKEVIGGRWPEAEERGKHYPSFVFHYSRTVLESRWPKYEIVIANYFVQKGNLMLRYYLKEFGITVDDLEISDDLKDKIIDSEYYRYLKI